MSLEDRIKSKDIGFDSLNPFMKKMIDPSAANGEDTGYFGMKNLWNRYAVPVVSNLYDRSNGTSDKSIYSKSELDGIFDQGTNIIDHVKDEDLTVLDKEWYERNGIPTPEYLKEVGNKGTTKNCEGTKSGDIDFLNFKKLTPRGKKILKNIVTYGALGVGAGALATGIALIIASNRKKKNKRKANEKRAAFLPDSWISALGRMASPELRMIDKALTAEDKSDYKSFNDFVRDYASRKALDKFVRVKDENGKEYEVWPGDIAVAFNKPIYKPGDKVDFYNAGNTPYSRALDTAFLQSMKDVSGEDPNHDMAVKWNMLQAKNDQRIVPLTMLASGMLGDNFRGHPSIGNLSYKFPFVLGQTAIRKNMTDGDIKKWLGSGLDKAFMESAADQINQYPAIRNALSAYVNGGFGRISKPDEYGIRNPMWDYQANAPTPYGSNQVHNVVRDIWNCDDTTDGKDKDQMAKEHYNEMLRLFDNVGKKVLKPNTVLGKQMLLHRTGGILPNVDKLLDVTNQYLDSDPTITDRLGLAVGKDFINDATSNLRDKVMNEAKGDNEKSE